MATIPSEIFTYLLPAAAVGFVAAWLIRNVHWSSSCVAS